MTIDNGTLAHLRDVADWPDLGERYEVTGRLGRGGMGIVFAAHDRVLNRHVAVKVLDDVRQVVDAPSLLKEARILGHLEHPGIVPVHDAGSLADGRVFYVMKLVRGERLDSAMGSRSLNERLDLFLRICDTVAFAHAQGIVHRDLKPENIMLGAFGEVLVMDWGIATHVQSADAAQVAGTPGFMAPEQERGISRVDARTDIFALGVILNALLREPAAPALRAIARHARAENVADRYVSVQDLARDIVRFREGERVSAYQESLRERVARFYRRYQLPILLVFAYVIMRVVLLTWRGV